MGYSLSESLKKGFDYLLTKTGLKLVFLSWIAVSLLNLGIEGLQMHHLGGPQTFEIEAINGMSEAELMSLTTVSSNIYVLVAMIVLGIVIYPALVLLVIDHFNNERKKLTFKTLKKEKNIYLNTFAGFSLFLSIFLVSHLFLWEYMGRAFFVLSFLVMGLMFFYPFKIVVQKENFLSGISETLKTTEISTLKNLGVLFIIGAMMAVLSNFLVFITGIVLYFGSEPFSQLVHPLREFSTAFGWTLLLGTIVFAHEQLGKKD